MGVLIRVNCTDCHGSGYTGNGFHFRDRCKKCSGLGQLLVQESEARSILLQKQIDDAKL